jgi:hypothetical protein
VRAIFETCKPREDVRVGELREDMFAARLRDVMLGTADPIYGDCKTFFEQTFPTDGLKLLLAEALGRLSGAKPGNAPIIRLETSFGGGKTHNLIGLYHAARHGITAKEDLKGFVDSKLLPKEPVPHIVGVVGSDLDPANGLDHGDAVVHTLWGEIAYQLGGAEAYELMRASDEKGAAPGSQIFEKLAGDAPVLIMLDEVAAFLRTAEAVRVGDSTLAEQTAGFLLSLLSFASASPRAVVVITLADSRDAFARETERVQEALVEAGKVVSRQERIITPTGEDEIAPIVVHRLFDYVDKQAAKETAAAYIEAFQLQEERGQELPERATRTEYMQEITTHYPFSPELITTLNRKTSTIPDFQRTRGALRLLALVVRDLWDTQPTGAWLIHPHDVNLGEESIANELTSRLKRPQYRQVIEADIASPMTGSRAHAAEIDDSMVEAGKPSYARRFATTVFLHSIVQGVASGVEPADAVLGTLTPTDEPEHILRAIDVLLDRAWFLDFDGHRYRFKTEPSLNKLVADEMDSVGRLKPKQELDVKIRNVWRKGIFQPRYFPSEAGDVDDDAGLPKLVVVHYDAATSTAVDVSPPELVLKIFEHSGTQEGYRTYKNNLVFLVAAEDSVDRLIDVARRYFAIDRLMDDPSRMSEFNDEQRKKLKGLLEEAELQYRIAITRAYRYLYYPSADAPKKHGQLACAELPAQGQGEIEKDQSQVLVRVLRQLDKILAADDKPVAAAFLKAKAWPSGKEYVSTEELRRAFAQRLGLRILLDPNQLKRSIRDGCKVGTWVYAPPKAKKVYGKPSPLAPVEISDDAMLYLPEIAERMDLPIEGAAPKTCPVCGKPVDECVCAKVCPVCGQDPCVCERPTPVLQADGAPGQAFQALLDQATDAEVERIGSLIVRVEGTTHEAAEDVRKLGLAIPQIGKADLTAALQLSCELEDGGRFVVDFAGGWSDYQQARSAVEAFVGSALRLTTKMQVQARFPGGLALESPQFESLKDVFSTLGFGRLYLSAETEEAAK